MTRVAHAHNLPAPLASFVGREAELARLATLFDGEEAVRLVTVVGRCGAGKTRLALAAAWALVPRVADGICWVELAGLQPAAGPAIGRATLAGAIAAALGLTPRSQRSPLKALAEALRGSASLLVLENCEHLPEVLQVVRTLLEAAPALRLLATSRAPLELEGETLLPLEGLPVPPADAPDSLDPGSYAGVRLFLDRAARLAPGWGQDPDELAGAARLCRLLDGLPLGIELAAHWVGHYTPDEIGSALQADLAFLAARTRDVPERQRSLQAVFDYTWRLLSPAERQALTRLAVFRGGFDRVAAQAAAGVRATTLVTLCDKSLLRRERTGRYSLHELLRQFAAERLTERGEAEAVGDRHRDWCLDLVEGMPIERLDVGQVIRLGRDQDNLRAALQRAIERQDVESALRLGIGEGVHWYMRGQYAERRTWLRRILALGFQPPQAGLHGRALAVAGHLAYCEGDLSEAEALLGRAVALTEDAGNLEGVGLSALFLGHVARLRRTGAEAEQRYNQALRIVRRLGGSPLETVVLSALAKLRYERGDLAGASAAAIETLELCALRDSPSSRARVLAIRSRLAELTHEGALADRLMADCLELEFQLHDPQGLAYAHMLAADTAHDRHCPVAAAQHLDVVLRLADETHDQWALARGLEGVAEMMAATEPEAALQHVGVAASVRMESGLAPAPIERARLDGWLDSVRAAVGAERAELLLQAGQAQPASEALARARAACAALLSAAADVEPN